MTPEEALAYTGPDRIVHFTEYLLLNAVPSKCGKTFQSGFQAFEEKMGGIETGEVVVISGNRKEGKTLFAESWLRSMATRDPEAKAMVLSYEVLPDKLLSKYVSNETQPIYLPLTLKTMDFEWLRKRCLEAKYKFNCKIILIDHLHFLVDMATQQNMSLNIGAFMRRLKHDIAINLNLAVILIAHQGQPREGREPSVDTIRDSSFVAQESDATVIVSRRENYNPVELNDYALIKGESQADLLRPPPHALEEDKFSSNLCLVKIDCHRRTGTYRWKKLFQKRGDFLVEV